MLNTNDDYWMGQALALARYAASVAEVPVGAVLVGEQNQLLAEGWNAPITNNDPTAHAEIQVLRQGALVLNNYRLLGTTMYVSLEPCLMCFGACINARIKRLVFAAYAPANVTSTCGYQHNIAVSGGVLAGAAGQVLQEFFKARR